MTEQIEQELIKEIRETTMEVFECTDYMAHLFASSIVDEIKKKYIVNKPVLG